MTNTDVVCMRDAKIADINGELKEIKRTCPNRYEHAILVCGGNDCAVADPQMSAIAESYKDLTTTAQSTAHKVTVSSVPHRLKPQHAPDAISSLNVAFQAMAVDMGVSFANNHDLFHLQNGDINDGYLHNDKIHLSLRGADALVKSIGIKLKHGCKTATSSHPKQSTALTWGTRTVHPGSKRGPGPSHNHVNETENNTNESMEHEQYLKLGITGNMLNVLKSMYSNVKSKVFYNGSTSDAFDNTLGVHQGDRLSPFLYAMYINDIEHSLSQCNTGIMFGCFKIVTLLYADDVILLSESAEGLQRGLDCMYEFCNTWRLKLNVNKSKIVIFKRGHVWTKGGFMKIVNSVYPTKCHIWD